MLSLCESLDAEVLCLAFKHSLSPNGWLILCDDDDDVDNVHRAC